MIVKDESKVIERCLNSVKPFIDHWVIVDTGSSDNTASLILDTLDGIPGSLHHKPWVNFAHNRNEALDFGRGTADYLLFIDADEQLQSTTPTTKWPNLVEDAYSLEAKYGELSYDRVSLINMKLPWQWRGVVHEHLDAGRPVSQPRVPDVWIYVRPEGARSSDPQKFQKDAAVLEEGLIAEPNNARYRFYLAQSYRDSGNLALARTNYQLRVEMGGWQEEVWYAMLQVASLTEHLGEDPVHAYMKAYDYRPGRAETTVNLLRYFLGKHNWNLAYIFGRIAYQTKMTTDRLFVNTHAYNWKVKDDFALAAFYSGRVDEARGVWQRLLAKGSTLPESQIERIKSNLGFCK
jgi:glycosyltransferase involved in cell wall biosynthesis